MGLDVTVELRLKADLEKAYTLDWRCGRNEANSRLLDMAGDGFSLSPEDAGRKATYHILAFDESLDGAKVAEGDAWVREIRYVDPGDVRLLLEDLEKGLEGYRKEISEFSDRAAFDRARMASAAFADIKKFRADARECEERIAELKEELEEEESSVGFVRRIADLIDESTSEYSKWDDAFLTVSFSY